MLHKLHIYIALLFLALVTYPMVEKTLHDFEHSHIIASNSSEIQFSETEDHHCEVCDLVLPTASTSDQVNFKFKQVLTLEKRQVQQVQTIQTSSPNYTFSLRGPPIYS
ncbi:MAG: hypothetical protein IT222_07985 [Crocinitomix sp.]|jgi:hypothetical protein|nr:hypothetical protein [Crocinitomix sp.]